ncbi:MAG: hypothetical protein KQH63_05925 [Desulfobulbaceae bacterium]|nr:hypothetical protein [Desulfobulbaceae bacterium]
MPILTRNRNNRKRLDPYLLLLFFFVACLVLWLGAILCSLPMGVPGLGKEVASLQQRSGVQSPVTAVLLNFRGYDTFLEVLVLLLAVIGVWSMTLAPFPSGEVEKSPVQLGVVRLLTPLMVLVGAYLVWQGSHLAGGAFQGGAVLGGAGVLLLVAELPWLRSVPSLPLRIALLAGPLVFFSVALYCLLRQGKFLAYPQDTAGAFLLIIETACALSIGVTLASLFAGGRPDDDLPETGTPSDPQGGRTE